MDASVPLVDLAPLLPLMGLALVVAMLPLSWWWLRQRRSDPRTRIVALTALTLFLTFDLIAFGAFTRLTDSGLGCPDWPGCYGSVTPIGARDEIQAAQTAMPTGPVTWSKAWIEMIHRYLAMAVGVLILVLAAFAWRYRRSLPYSPWWPTVTLAWVIVQGAFGKYTVTLKLYPAVVTLHLIGGLVLLGLLAVQWRAARPSSETLPQPLKQLAWVALAVLGMQVALGGWVSTNYAVLACSGFPTCNGQWWPSMDLSRGFALLRHLGHADDGALLPFESLVGIHMAHRLFAAVATLTLGFLAWRLWRAGYDRPAMGLALLLAAQVASGLSNVVLGWPLVAALAHTAGAAALVLLLTTVASRPAT